MTWQPPIDDTHDPALRELGGVGERRRRGFPDPEPAARRVPSAATGGDLVPRVGAAIGDRCWTCGAAAEARPAATACRRGDSTRLRAWTLNALMALAPEERLALRRAIAGFLDAANGSQRARRGCAYLRAAGGRRTARCRRHRRLHRLLRVDLPRDERRAACSAPTTRCCPTTSTSRSATTAARRRSSPSGTPVRRPNGQTRGGRRAALPVLRPDGAARLRARGRRLHRHRATRSARRSRWRRRERHIVRPVPGERLVGARHAGVGVPAARAVPREELRDDASRLDGDAWRRWRRSACRPSRAPAGDPRRCPTSTRAANRAHGGFDITLEVLLTTRADARGGMPGRAPEPQQPVGDCTGRSRRCWRTTRATAATCGRATCWRAAPCRAPSEDSRGCLLELTWRGANPVALPTGETRKFLEDGDEVVMRGWCSREGYRRIGFGECRGTVTPAA